MFEVDIAKELRRTRENNDQFKAELNILEREVRTCEIGIEKVEGGFDYLHQEYSYYKNETERLIQKAKIESIQCNLSNLQLNEDIAISLIRQIDDAREHDVCLGSSTIFGIITAKSCCQADELFLYDLTNSEEVPIDDAILWVEENICFINTTNTLINTTFEIDVAITDDDIHQSCSIMTYDKSQEKFEAQIFELIINQCFENNCLFKIDSELLTNQIILNGTSISCDESKYVGIITKSKSSILIKIES